MKKIMFDDHYGLTTAVMEGRKTQTRRTVPRSVCLKYEPGKESLPDFVLKNSRYKVGDVVAVAESYRTIFDNVQHSREYAEAKLKICKAFPREFIPEKVFGNKMFVRPELMPHRIKITEVRVQHLQDISEKDCYAEGVERNGRAMNPSGTARVDYAWLVDKISGKGTWAENPLVYAYTFRLC